MYSFYRYHKEMGLSENTKYQTIGGKKVEIQGNLDIEEVLENYAFELSQILNLEKISKQDKDKILHQQKIVYGTIDDPTMPGGLWHEQSGKCLGGSIKSKKKKGEDIKKRFKNFDIKIE